MFVGFAVVESLAFAGCNWGAVTDTGADCGLCACAARAEERRGFNRSAAIPNKTHEIAAMDRTDERRKVPPGTYQLGCYPALNTHASYDGSSPRCLVATELSGRKAKA